MEHNLNESKFILFVEILLVLAFVILDAYGYAFISQTIPILILVSISLRLKKDKWNSIGLSRTKNFFKFLGLGLIIGILLELVAIYITTPFISSLFSVEPDYSSFEGIRGNRSTLIFYIVLSWALAAFGEEICFRGYLMTRVAQLFNKGPQAWIISLVLTSILFGYGHTDQGVSGWVQEGLSGLFLGILYLATGKNLVVPIVSHGISNTLAFIMMYYGVYPGIGY
ncbi:MAG: type II CAAX endopeptidase family protein [Balneola sp.]